MAIYMEELLHGETDGCCQFHNAQMPTFFQHPAHLAQSLVEVGKVTDAKGRCDGIKAFIGIGEGSAVFILERNDALQPSLPDLLAAYLH